MTEIWLGMSLYCTEGSEKSHTTPFDSQAPAQPWTFSHFVHSSFFFSSLVLFANIKHYTFIPKARTSCWNPIVVSQFQQNKKKMQKKRLLCIKCTKNHRKRTLFHLISDLEKRWGETLMLCFCSAPFETRLGSFFFSFYSIKEGVNGGDSAQESHNGGSIILLALCWRKNRTEKKKNSADTFIRHFAFRSSEEQTSHGQAQRTEASLMCF